MSLHTTRRNIEYPNPDRSDIPDIAHWDGILAAAIDLDVVYDQGTDAARIAAVHQASGGRFWWTTDTHLMWYDDGAGWHPVSPLTQMGAISTIPGANTVPASSRFFATDMIAEYISDGANWIRVSTPAGVLEDYGGGVVPSGYILADGASYLRTGIYADLFANYGTTYGNVDGSHFNVLDSRGRVTVGLATGGKAEVATLGHNEGLAVNLRNISHHHQEQAGAGSGGGPQHIAVAGYPGDTAYSDYTLGDADNLNNPANIVVNKIIKL